MDAPQKIGKILENCYNDVIMLAGALKVTDKSSATFVTMLESFINMNEILSRNNGVLSILNADGNIGAGLRLDLLASTGDLVIGSAEECVIRLKINGIEQKQALIHAEGTKNYVFNPSGNDKVKVNNKLIGPEKVLLEDNDVLEVGTKKFKYEIII